MLKIIKESNEILSSDELVRELKKVLTKDELDRHETDLYAKVTPKSKKLVNRYEFKTNVTTFKSELDGTLWYDIPFIAGRVDESINKENQDIREWYLATYPTDEVGEDILKGRTFKELQGILATKKNFYGYIFGHSLGAGDSLVRERIFQKLSEISGVPYGEIYDQWLLGESKKKVTRTKKELKESLKKLTSEMDIEIKDKDLIKEIESHLGYSELDGRDIQEIKDAKIIFNSEIYNDGVHFQLDLKFNAYLKDFNDDEYSEWEEFEIIDGPAYSGWYERIEEDGEIYFDVEMEQQMQQYYWNKGLRIISEVIDTLGLHESIYYEMDKLVRENVDEPNNLEEQLKLNKTSINIDYTNEDYLLTPYWYFTRHGVGPGSIPKNVSVWTSFRADGGYYFATSDVINTKDLKEFEIKEKQPEIESIPEKSRVAIQKYLEEPISKNDELISKRAEKLVEKELGKKPVSIKLEKVGSLNTVTALLENKQTVKYILLGNDLYSI